MGTTTYASRAGQPDSKKSIRLRTWGSQVRDLPGAPSRRALWLRPQRGRRSALPAGMDDGARRKPKARDLVAEYERQRANEYNLKPNTVAEYRRHLDAFVDHCGDVAVDDIDHEHVHGYLGACAPGSLPSRFSVLAAMLRWADESVAPGMASLVPRRKPTRRWRTRVLTVAELAVVVEHIADRRTKPRARPVTLDAIEFGIACPLRRSEIASLQIPEVDLEGSRLFLHDTKTGNRVVPMASVARSIARRRILNAPGAHLFPARDRLGHMLAESLSHAWKRIARACGLDDVPFHCLRRTWASEALRAGASLEYVRRVLGHTTEWMSAQYAHITCTELQQVVDSVEARIFGGRR